MPDQVGGYAQDAYPFIEAYGHAETRVWRHLYLGASVSYRQDLNNYNFAVANWRGVQARGVAGQAFIGYEAPAFHISMGPWLYGSNRRRPDFRATVILYGLLRLRFGSLDAWHTNMSIGDGAPFTTLGAYGARIMVGAPSFGAHRAAVGLYTTIGEKVAGLVATDEFASPFAFCWRFGGTVGTMIDQLTHMEVAGFVGFVM